MTDWVPFHEQLCKGPKKGWPRAVRFVLLELAREARRTHGVLRFPPGWDLIRAVHDLLGGDRREIRKALTLFQIRDDLGQSVIEIERDVSELRLRITKFSKWAGPKTNAERQAEFKENRRLQDNERYRQVTEVTPTGQDRTVEERREEPPLPPAGDTPAAPAPKLKRVPRVGTGLPEDWQPTDVDRAFAAAKGWPSDKVASEAERFRAHHLAKGTVSKDWAASWRTWAMNDEKFSRESAPRLRIAAPLKQVDTGQRGWVMPEPITGGKA